MRYQRRQHLAAVGNDAERDIAQPADFLRVDLDMDQPRRPGNQSIAGSQSEQAEAHPEREDDVRALAACEIRHLVERPAVERV